MKIKPKKWGEFQHYSDRRPPWIKLHRALLDDRAFHSLPIDSKALAPMLWLLASEHPDGHIDADHEELAFRLRWPVHIITSGLSPLIDKGFFVILEDSASTAIADGSQGATPEREGEAERETETSSVPLPRDGAKRGKGKAERRAQALEYLEFLNARAGRYFRPVDGTLRMIEARLSEGITLQDLKTLTARKCREWLGTDMAKFLRPETLCNRTKCHSYLGEIPPEETPTCNAPDATAASSLPPDPALAGGPCPTPSSAAKTRSATTRIAGDAPGMDLPGAAGFPVH